MSTLEGDVHLAPNISVAYKLQFCAFLNDLNYQLVTCKSDQVRFVATSASVVQGGEYIRRIR